MKMGITVSQFEKQDIECMIRIWNEIVEDGIAFPQTELLTEETGDTFFTEQTYTGVAVEEGVEEVVGLYILHPNNIGRCGHICNVSFAVSRRKRGLYIGEKLVQDCRWL